LGQLPADPTLMVGDCTATELSYSTFLPSFLLHTQLPLHKDRL